MTLTRKFLEGVKAPRHAHTGADSQRINYNDIIGIPPKATSNTYSTSLSRSSAQFFSRADNANLEFATLMTLECWVKVGTAPTAGQVFGIISKNNATGNQRSYRFEYLNNAGTMQLRYVNSTAGTGVDDSLTVNQTLTAGTWYHVALTVDLAGAPKQAIFYVNGSQVGATQTPTIASHFDSTADFRIGSGTADASDHWDGNIDDVRVWSVVRTQSQIANNRSTEIDTATSLKGSWHLNNTVNDASGNSLTLTNNASAIFVTDTPF